MDAGDDRTGDRGDDDRREGAQRVMADHHFEREEHAGDRRVERSRDRRRDAAAEQGDHLGPRQGEPRADEGGEARAQMDDGALASHRGAGPDRRGAAEGGAETRPPIHPARPERDRFHDVGDALRLRARHDEAVEQADQQTAGGRRGDEFARPGDFRSRRSANRRRCRTQPSGRRDTVPGIRWRNRRPRTRSARPEPGTGTAPRVTTARHAGSGVAACRRPVPDRMQPARTSIRRGHNSAAPIGICRSIPPRRLSFRRPMSRR